MTRRQQDRQNEITKCEAVSKAAGTMQSENDALSKCYGEMQKAAGDPDGKMYGKIADHFSKVAAACGEVAKAHDASIEYHQSAMKTEADEIEKRLDKTIVPDRFGSVSFSDAPAAGFGYTAKDVRAIPRAGAPETGINKAKVPVEFRHLVDCDDVF